jgi:hypothetical protein
MSNNAERTVFTSEIAFLIPKLKTGLLNYLPIFLMLIIAVNAFSLSSNFRVISADEDHAELLFELSDYELITNTIEGEKYYRIFHPEAGYLLEEGLPELPVFSVSVIIPDRGTVSLQKEIIDRQRMITDISVMPSQGYDMVIDESRGFLKDDAFYSKNEEYPLYLTRMSEPAVIRDYRFVTVTVAPFSFNPSKAELTIKEEVRVRIDYNRSRIGANEITRAGRKLSRSFENIYRGIFLNYDQNRDTTRDYQARSILVIHHHSLTIQAAVNNFVNWKRDKGFEITAVSTEDLTSNTVIKNYIQNAYNNWDNPPEYVVLMGGGSGSFQIPTFYANGAYGDHPYGLLEGNDDIPDVFVGRVPIVTVEQSSAMWNKIRYYEKEPYLTDTDWYERALLVGDSTTSSGISPKFTIKYVKELMLLYNEEYQFVEHYSGSASTVINNAINQGVSLFPFRGYIGMAGWSPEEPSLTNGAMMPNAFFMTCSTLAFSNTSKTEAIVIMGTPATLKGAVSAIGMNTSSTKTAFNNALTGSFFYGIFNENIRTMGETLARGKIFLHQTFGTVHPSEPQYHTQKASLIGDPSMDIWVEEPKPMNVAYQESLPQGANYIDITVTGNDDQPLENAWVTVRQVEGSEELLFTTGYTDQLGNITHYFEPDTSGSVKVTVTKPDYIPHLGEFSFDGGPSVSLHTFSVNGVTDAGNDTGIVVTLKNYLDRTASHITGILTTDSDYITILNGNSSYNDIPVGATGESLSEYLISISPSTPSGYTAQFNLQVNESFINFWDSKFSLTINNGFLVPAAYGFSGGEVIDPGQTAAMNVTLRNDGVSNTLEIYGVLRGSGGGLTTIDSTAYFGNINAGEEVTNLSDSFSLSASGSIIPGTIINRELYLYNDTGFEQSVPLQIPVGSVTVADPLGPDSYGYRCYDDGDTNYGEVPEYDWQEIAPHLGGSGVNTGLDSDHGNNQQVMNMPLPFSFRFYGVIYDTISICANGWISFGITEQATFRNYYLPGPMGPNPMIAAFWDNLSLASGGVYTYFDELEDIFIIQWQNAANRVSNAEETFQIILYNQETHYSDTNDGNIKIQYKVFNNLNSQGSPEWGNYCTVGISDHTGNEGLTYTFANQYPVAAQPLTDETAIFLTTGAIDYDNAYVTLESVSFSGGNSSLPQYGETLEMNVSLSNNGGNTAGSVSATLSSNDQYIEITGSTALFGIIDSGDVVTLNEAFSFTITDDVPDQHQVRMILNIQSDQGINWQQIYRFNVQAPEIGIKEPYIYDFLPDGNSNGIIEPGEIITINIPVENSGNAVSQAVAIDVFLSHPEITIIEVLNTERPYLASDETIYPSLVFSVGSEIPLGSNLPLVISAAAGEYSAVRTFNLVVGGEMTVQLGSGTSTNGTTTANPINIYYRSLRGQMVYTAAELTAAGLSSGGLITELGFYVTSSPLYELPNFTIRMKHTTASNASSHDNGPFTTVYHNPSYMPAAGDWDMLTLDPDSSFHWNGTDNILVDTAFAQVSPNWNSSGQQRIYSETNGFRFVRADYSDQTESATTTTSSSKPQVKMVFGGVSSGDMSTNPQNLAVELIEEAVSLEWQAPSGRENEVIRDTDSNPSLRSGRPHRNERRAFPESLRTLLGYNVYRNGSKLNQALVGNTFYVDDEVATLGDYFYYVTAVYPDSESGPSNISYIELESRVESPVFDPAGGYFSQPQFVTISTITENTIIHYTLNGEEPDESSPEYYEPVYIQDSTLLKAKGYRENWLASEITEDYYVIMYPPGNVQISRAGEQMLLEWEAASGASGYHIYFSDEMDPGDWGEPVFTEETNYYYDLSGSEGKKFFHIKAVYGESEVQEREVRQRSNY